MSAPRRPEKHALNFAVRALLGGALLLGLAACEHYAPNERPDRDSTEAITRAQMERIQSRSATRVMAPSQIRIATGGFTQPENAVCRDWLNPCWEEGADTPAPAAGTPELMRTPRPAPAQTFRGVLPCQDAAMGCSGQHTVLTLFVNQMWRAQLNYLDAAGRGSTPATLQGCWERSAQDERRLRLYHQNGSLLGEFQAASNNTLVFHATEQVSTNLNYTLTRQPDPDVMGGQPQAVSCAK